MHEHRSADWNIFHQWADEVVIRVKMESDSVARLLFGYMCRGVCLINTQWLISSKITSRLKILCHFHFSAESIWDINEQRAVKRLQCWDDSHLQVQIKNSIFSFIRFLFHQIPKLISLFWEYVQPIRFSLLVNIRGQHIGTLIYFILKGLLFTGG